MASREPVLVARPGGRGGDPGRWRTTWRSAGGHRGGDRCRLL